MDKQNKTAGKILDAAERMARHGGYNAFSFRDIAKTVGISSASVHHHFPTKEDLGVTLVRRYTARFIEQLADPARYPTAEDALAFYIRAYRNALVQEGAICLCAIFGAQTDTLPMSVKAEAGRFFLQNIRWLDAALDKPGFKINPQDRYAFAVQTVAILDGAMILSQTLDRIDIFDHATRNIFLSGPVQGAPEF